MQIPLQLRVSVFLLNWICVHKKSIFHNRIGIGLAQENRRLGGKLSMGQLTSRTRKLILQ